ncbi:MAG: cGMP-dependent protein kinase 1 isoform X1 [Magnetococcales bacterium]|nr:cGMP-dependent protein kinase 1 isoform X1 [Magnetococcales bacterium]
MDNNITFDDLVRFFSKIPGFKSIAEQDLRNLVAPIVCISTYEANQTIIRTGEPGDTLYMLYDGQVRVDFPANNSERKSDFMESGDIFGEMALVSQARRSANVVATQPCTCLTIDAESFQDIMKNHWRIARAVAGLVGERFVARATSKKDNPKPDRNNPR